MKNVLFATTALIATAGIASADLSVGGNAHMGVIYNAGDATTDATTDVIHSVRITFGASVETDAGVAFGASARITESGNGNNGQLEHNQVNMTSGGFTLRVGATHGAMRNTARVTTYLGFNRGGVVGNDNSIVGVQNDGGDNVLVMYKTGDLTVAASTDVGGLEQEVGVGYTMNGFNLGLGVNTADGWMFKAGYSGGNYAANLGLNSDNDAVLTFSYDISDATSLAFGAEFSTDGGTTTTDYIGAQVSHDLGGASLVGTIGQNNDVTVAGLGVSFSF
ncbi:porin [Planktotalea sp.]|uniref:porin n=1 Tax=Planktotalea sp. TaxID=2029877 RepID=UPI0025D14063|nr:porin [Planktotalea sp.]